MYRRADANQLRIEEFFLPFGRRLNADNRWVRLTKLMPWDYIEEVYARSLSEDEGRSAIPARIAFGAIYIKEQERLPDEGCVQYIQENPYAQYFLWLKEFCTERLFNPSMMVHCNAVGYHISDGPVAIEPVPRVTGEGNRYPLGAYGAPRPQDSIQPTEGAEIISES
jgi:hypothetical protein